MTRFADQLFDDLMREHGDGLARATMPPAAKRHLTARPVLMTAGAGGVAVATAIGTLIAGGGAPAYAVTTHPDGMVTLAVYQTSGIAGANSKLHQLGDRVAVVPVEPGCPSISSLPTAGVPAAQISVEARASSDGSVTVDAQGVPAGDILVLGPPPAGGRFAFSMPAAPARGGGDHPPGAGRAPAAGTSDGTGPGSVMARATGIVSRLTSGPAPSCVSIPATAVPRGPGDMPAGGSAGRASAGNS